MLNCINCEHTSYTGVLKKQIIKIFLHFLLFLSPALVGAQNYASDLAKLETGHDDTAKIGRLIRFYNNYFVQTDDSVKAGLKYILDAYYLAIKLDYKRGIVDASYLVAANMLTFKNVNKATDFYFITLKNAEEIGDRLMEGKSLMGLGLVFYNQKKWKEAKEYFDRSLSVATQSGETQKVGILNYLNGLCYNELLEFDKARLNLTNAYQMALLNSDSNQINECTIGLAKVDFGIHNFDSALMKYDQTKVYYEAHEERIPLAIIHEGKSKIYLAQNKLNEALIEAIDAYKIALSSSANINLAEITELLYIIYDKKGNTQMAFKFLLENSHIKDSLNNQDISEKISLANSNYEFEKKEAKFNDEIEKNKRRKNMALFSATFLAVFILFGFLAYRSLRKERKKSEELLLNILPKETKEELEKFGKAIPKKHPSATIMFCDVQGFTSISSSMSAETLVSMLDYYFRKFDEIITFYGLEKIKTIGDAYMCAGGLHQLDEQKSHAKNAVDAAIEIMKFNNGIAEEMKRVYGSAFNFRIGIHSGNVVSGVVGSKKYAYDIWGDTVNVAARMEQASEAGKINISGDTFKLIDGQYKIDHRGKIKAKHKGELDMYFIRID